MNSSTQPVNGRMVWYADFLNNYCHGCSRRSKSLWLYLANQFLKTKLKYFIGYKYQH